MGNTASSLAGRAEVSAAPAYDDAFDGGGADAAGLAGAAVDVVVELKEAGYAVGVYIVGDGGAAQFDRLGEDLDKGRAEAAEFGPGETAGVAERTNAGMEEGLVGVDVADAVEQALVEQRGL